MYYDYQWDRPARPAWLTTRLIIRLSAALIAVAVLVTGLLTWRATRPEPFRVANPVVVFGGVSVEKDHTFHMGLLDIESNGKDVTVLEVTPLMSENIEFLGAVTNYGTDVRPSGGAGSAGSSFPPPSMHAVHPIGEVIPASATTYVPKGWDKPAPIILTAGFRLASGDDGGVNGVRVVYKIGSKTRTEIARFAIVPCIGSCKKAAKKDDDHYEKVLRSHGLLPVEKD